MSMIRQFRRTALFVSCMLLFSFMVGDYRAHDPPAAYAFSAEDERVLGEKVLAEVRRQHELVNDPFATRFMNDLGLYLAGAIENTPFRFHFYIIKSPQLNAFAAPGGHIFFYTGIIEVMDRIDELAAVLCHELAHVSERHTARRIEQSKKIGLATLAGALAGALIGGKAGGAVMTGSAAAGVQVQLHYSRNDEREADFRGFKYMNVSGFDPSGMITVLNKIQKGQWIDLGKVPAYLQTHPTGPERMAGIDTLLSGYSPGEVSREAAELKARFPYFKAYLKAKYADSAEAVQFFRKAVADQPDAAAAFFGLGVLLMERKEYEEAADHFEKALERDPHALPVAQYLGEAYQLTGRSSEGTQILEKLYSTHPQDRTILFLLARSYQEGDQFAKAIPLYETLITMTPVNDEAYHHLGVCYGREGRMGLSHYYFGIYFQKIGKHEKALFHFSKAETLAGNDPLLLDRIRKARYK